MSDLSKAEQYRVRSEQAEHRAAVAKDPKAKIFFTRIAQHWRDMAQEAEHRSLNSLARSQP